MKMSTFLLGGVVGAAAAIYLTKRAKPMLFSALSSNEASSGLLHSGLGRSGKHADTQSAGGLAGASSKKASSDSLQLGIDGLGKVEEIIRKDPKLKEAVDEIIAGSAETAGKEQNKEQHAH
ncbi:hypothetical protein [Paenibacillus puerhi]|uniref:hypothetical protein n=1 Tax=Paenibacillus puerhi TaxID=2692622 RepID=UPI00135B0D07|nr:hypothetical protein [Paenibacillus puerhi]